MSSVSDLKDAVKEALQRKGLLPQLQASMRSQIFSMLLAAEDAPRPEPCDETLVINELIREYLVFHGLRDTLSVFLPESGQPAVRPFDREFLAAKMRITDTSQSQQLPLLYQLVAMQQQPARCVDKQQHLQQQQQHRLQAASGSSPCEALKARAGRLMMDMAGQQQPQPHQMGKVSAGNAAPPGLTAREGGDS